MVQLTNVPYFPYPAVAFNFAVWVDGVSGNSGNGAAADAAFQEISGIKVEYETVTVAEGGENRFEHRLPTPTKYSNLVLKRGVVVETSRLSQWVGESLGSTLARPIRPRQLMVTLRNENFEPLITWTFTNAYPVRWETSPLNSMENAILTETMELCYNYFTRQVTVPKPTLLKGIRDAARSA
jgi:phage tail-like protein